MKSEFYLKQVNAVSVIITLLFIVVSCTSETYYDEKTAAKIYVDLLVIEESNLYDADSVKIKRDEYFLSNNIDQEKYERTMSGYELDEKKWNKFFNEAELIIDSLKNEADQELQSSS